MYAFRKGGTSLTFAKKCNTCRSTWRDYSINCMKVRVSQGTTTWRPFSELFIFPRTTPEQELNPRPYAYCLSPRYLHPVVFKDGGFGRLKIVSLFACIPAVSVEYFSFFLLKHLKIFLLIASGKFLCPLPRNLKRRLRAIRCLLTRNRSVEG